MFFKKLCQALYERFVARKTSIIYFESLVTFRAQNVLQVESTRAINMNDIRLFLNLNVSEVKSCLVHLEKLSTLLFADWRVELRFLIGSPIFFTSCYRKIGIAVPLSC